MSENNMQEDVLEWCGYHWKSTMEGGRRIHPSYPWYWYSKDCTYVDESDMLHLFVRRNPKEIKHWDGKIYKPTVEVGTLRSVESFGFGRFSAEIIMPMGRNLSASFWLSGANNWPPEIDIEEGWTEEKYTYYRIFERYFPWYKPGWRTTNNVHYRDDSMTHRHIGSRNVPKRIQPKNPAYNYVRYECEWLPDSITFYTDGKRTRSVDKSVCRMMRENTLSPGVNMNVILNVWTENPEICEVLQFTDMLVRDFKYEPRVS